MTGFKIIRKVSKGKLHGGAEQLPVISIEPEVDIPINLVCSWYTISPGEACNLHKHLSKTEVWFIVQGKGILTLGQERIEVERGTVIYTPPNVPHGLKNSGNELLVFINVAHPPISEIDSKTGLPQGTIELEF